MGRRREGNQVSVDKDGYIHIEVNGCRIVMPPSREAKAKLETKARMRQTRMKFPAAVEAASHH